MLYVLGVRTVEVPHQRLWVYAIPTFVVTLIALAYVREGAYRFGPGDSANRMLIHIAPLVVVAILAAVGKATALLATHEVEDVRANAT